MAIQCKESTKSKRAEPTAGPSEDDRYGPNPIAPHTRLRIHRTDVVGGRTRIMIAGGTTHGVYLDMEGAVLSSTGPIANFRIHQVTPTASYAFVATTVDEVRGKLVTLGPTTRPPATRDQEARVLHVGTEDGQTRIVIGCGTEQGVTLGMRGTLVGSNIDFEIAVVDARKSIAFVKASFDEIDQTRLVTLHAAKPRTAIQRRATGAAAAADVQTTAVAGVASASAALPHLATIQRAFGKHDVSNLRTQTGGAATQAAAALGAEAYATGDRVAFASSPDLHTAAHEAAHTIQQRRGAVGFQGLGAAGDEHERHADAVADAVVAGRSAEPLLDALGGGGGAPAAAVQRKVAAHEQADHEERSWIRPAHGSESLAHVGSIYFRTKDAHLDADDRALLDELAKAYTPYAKRNIGRPGLPLGLGGKVIGYADPRGSAEPSNHELSIRRAEVVARAAERALVDATRLDIGLVHLNAIGAGVDPDAAAVTNAPLAEGNTLAPYRRADLFVQGRATDPQETRGTEQPAHRGPILHAPAIPSNWDVWEQEILARDRGHGDPRVVAHG